MRLRRREILEKYGVALSPADVQRFFWQRYNSPKRRQSCLLGEIATEMMSSRVEPPEDEFGRMEQAWRSSVPLEYVNRSRVEGFSNGTLHVSVDGAAVRYVLTRQLANCLMAAMNERLGRITVKRLDCRIGRLPAVGRKGL